MRFKVGDIIRGKKGNGYSWTNEEMTKAEVINTSKDEMKIICIKHKDNYFKGDIVWVDNDESKFEFIETKMITKEELLDMPKGTKITTDGKGHNEYTYDGECFSNIGYCIKNYEINDDLTLDVYDEEECGTKIIKIEKPSNYEIVYERIEKPKEMTVAEIEKELGYAVKIVKEEN